MKLENQVVSLDLAKRLKELGVKPTTAIDLYWLKEGGSGFMIKQLWMNEENAKHALEFKQAIDSVTKFEIVPCTISFTPTSK